MNCDGIRRWAGRGEGVSWSFHQVEGAARRRRQRCGGFARDAAPGINCSSIARLSFMRGLIVGACFCEYAVTPIIELSQSSNDCFWRNADVRREADVSQVPNSRERNRMSKATSGYFPRSRMSRGLSSGAHSRDPAAHARLLALRGAETNFRSETVAVFI